MGGQIFLSSSGHEARMKWWRQFQNSPVRWTMILPTRGQVELTRASFMDISAFFGEVTWLEGLAARLAVELGLTEAVVDEAALAAQLGEEGARQVLAWQRAGILLAAAAPPDAGEIVSRWAAIEEVDGLATAPWCVTRVVDGLGSVDKGALGGIYVENLYAPSPVELRLLQALSEVTEVILRVRDVAGAAAIEQSYAPMLAALVEKGSWTVGEDDRPADYMAQQKVASGLFPTTPRLDRGPLPGGDEIRVRAFDSVDAEVRGIADQLRRLLAGGGLAGNIVVALPNTPSYRRAAAAHLPASGAPLHWVIEERFLPPAESADRVDVIAHRDIAGRSSLKLFVGGADGAPDALPPGGGWSPSDPALLPAILLDAVEARMGPLYLSSVRGSESRYTESVARAFGGATTW